MAGELVNVRDDHGAPLLPGGAADASAEGDAAAGDRALEGTQHQLFAANPIEPGPPEAHRLMDKSRNIRHPRNLISLALQHGADLLH